MEGGGSQYPQRPSSSSPLQKQTTTPGCQSFNAVKRFAQWSTAVTSQSLAALRESTIIVKFELRPTQKPAQEKSCPIDDVCLNLNSIRVRLIVNHLNDRSFLNPASEISKTFVLAERGQTVRWRATPRRRRWAMASARTLSCEGVACSDFGYV